MTDVQLPPIRFPDPPTDQSPRALLAASCQNDAKCVCVMDAVFKHDSSWATAGVGKRALNPCNMRIPGSWTPPVTLHSIDTVNGTFARFDSLKDGIQACVETYNRFYSGMSADRLVAYWTGGGNANYRAAVGSCY